MELSFLLNIYENDYILLPIATNVLPKIMSFRAPYVSRGEFSYEENSGYSESILLYISKSVHGIEVSCSVLLEKYTGEPSDIPALGG